MIRVIRWISPDGSMPTPSSTRRGQSPIYNVWDPNDIIPQEAVLLPAAPNTPRKTDLDPSHKLYNKRVLDPGISGGQGDIYVDDAGSFFFHINGVDYEYMEIVNGNVQGTLGNRG